MGDLSDLKSSQPVRVTGQDEEHAVDVKVFGPEKRMLVEEIPHDVPLDVLYRQDYLLNGTSPEMNVNGSLATPRNFSFAPPPGQIYFLESISILIMDNGTMDNVDFGAIAGLTNGVKIEVQSKGILSDFVTLKNNMDIGLVFNRCNPPNHADVTGFLNTDDWFLGTCDLKRRIKLNGDQGDFIRFSVRDNLTGVDILRAMIKTYQGNN